MLRAHGRTILVDTGVGGPTSPAMSWYPAPGRLMGALAESGTSPADIDTVVVTHVHDDHIGGTVTDEGAPAFPNARYVINRIDLDRQEHLAQQTEEDRAIWDILLAPLRSRGVLQAIDDAYEVAPGSARGISLATRQAIRSSMLGMAGLRCSCRATRSTTRPSCRSPSWRPGRTTTPRPPAGCAEC